MVSIRARWIKGKGFVQEQVREGSGAEESVDLDGASGLSPHTRKQITRTASATLDASDVGMNVVSGTSGPLTFTLPDPADVPLAVYGFRMEDARAHVVTSSAGPTTLPFVPTVSTGEHSSDVTMAAVVGSSVIFQSDGLHYVEYVASGTHTFA